MATVDKHTADKIASGEYRDDDPIAVRIVKYQNIFNGGDAYGVTFEGEDKTCYLNSENCLHPVLYWDLTIHGYREI